MMADRCGHGATTPITTSFWSRLLQLQLKMHNHKASRVKNLLAVFISILRDSTILCDMMMEARATLLDTRSQKNRSPSHNDKSNDLILNSVIQPQLAVLQNGAYACVRSFD